MKEMKLHELEEESLSRVFNNHLIYSKNMIDQIESQIKLLKDLGYRGAALATLENQLKQAKEQHEDTKQGIAYWKQKIKNLDDITEVYL